MNKKIILATVVIIVFVVFVYIVDFALPATGMFDGTPEIYSISYTPDHICLWIHTNKYTKTVEIVDAIVDGETITIEPVTMKPDPPESGYGTVMIPYDWTTMPYNVTLISSTGERFSILHPEIMQWLQRDFEIILPKLLSVEFEKYGITATETTNYPIIYSNMTRVSITSNDWKTIQNAIKGYVDDYLAPNNVHHVTICYWGIGLKDIISVYTYYCNANGFPGTAKLEIRMNPYNL